MPTYTESAVKDYVDTRFTAATNYADAAKTELNSFLSDLSAQITSFTGTAIDFSGVTFPSAYVPGSVSEVVPTAPTVPGITTPSVPTAPTVTAPTVAFDSAPVVIDLPTFPTAPVLTALPSVSPGTLAVAPSTTITASETMTDSDVHTNLISNLNTALTTSKILSSAEEQALYTRAINRTALENERIEDNATNLWASRGFEVPSDVLNAIINQATTEQTRNNLEINAEVLAKSGELAMQAASVALQTAVNYESNWLQHIDSLNQRALQAKISSTELAIRSFEISVQQISYTLQASIQNLNGVITANQNAITLYSAQFAEAELRIKKYLGDVQGYDSSIKAETARISVLGDIEKTKVELYDSTVKALGLKTEAEIAAAKATVDLYVAQLEGYSKEVQTNIATEQLKLAGNENAVKVAEAQKELILKQAELQIREEANLLQIQLDSLKSGAQVNAQIVASALSSFNSNISYGFSGGWNENDYYDQTKTTVSETIVHNLTA